MADDRERENATKKKEKEYRFQLIQFVEQSKNGRGSYDCVPNHWIKFDTETGKLVTKFSKPPYTKESSNLLHSLVKTIADPPESWPVYEVIIKGRADTYTEAVKRVEALNSQEYAYTTESETLPAKIAESQLKLYQKKALKENKLLLKTVMEVPKLSKTVKKPIYDEEYSESGNNSDARQSLSSDGAPSIIRKKAVRSSKKTSKFRRPVKRSTNSQKKKQTSIQSSKRAQVIYSDSDTADSDIDIPNPSPRSSNEFLSSADHSSANINKISRPSCNIKNKCDSPSLPSPSVATRAGYPTVERVLTVQKKVVGVVHSANPSAKNSKRTTQPEYNNPMQDENHNEVEVDDPHDANLMRTIPKNTLLILTAIKKLSGEVKDCQDAIQNLQAMLQRSKIVQDMVRDARSFVVKYGLEIPLRSVAEFKLFDQKLKDDAKCREDFVASLQFLVNPENNPKRTVTAVLKKYMTRDVALQFTAIKDSVNKKAFKDMNFCACLLDLVVQAHTDKNGAPLCEKTFYQCLGTSFANAKDWEGHRMRGGRR